MALRHEKRLLQKSEINLGREGTAQAANFPELRSEIVALKKLEQEQKEVALRIARIEEGIKRIEEERQQNAREQSEVIARLESEKKPLLQQRNQAKNNVEVCGRELAGVERRIQESEAADRDLLKQLSDLHALDPAPADLEARSAGITARRARLPERQRSRATRSSPRCADTPPDGRRAKKSSLFEYRSASCGKGRCTSKRPAAVGPGTSPPGGSGSTVATPGRAEHALEPNRQTGATEVLL